MVNKPAGVPVVPSVDNVVESCLACVAQARSPAPPHGCHSLARVRLELGIGLGLGLGQSPMPCVSEGHAGGCVWRVAASRIELCRVRGCCLCISRRAGRSGGRTQWWQRNLASDRRGGQALGEEEPLRPTHRLDACTAGLVVLGRTAAFVAGFNKLLAAAGPPRAVRKTYRALSAAPPPLGALLAHLAMPLPTPQRSHHPPNHPCAMPGHRDLSVRYFCCFWLQKCAHSDPVHVRQAHSCTGRWSGHGCPGGRSTRSCTRTRRRGACTASWRCCAAGACAWAAARRQPAGRRPRPGSLSSSCALGARTRCALALAWPLKSSGTCCESSLRRCLVW